jgi:5-methylcytosine-specific restriction endonuclease McrA
LSCLHNLTLPPDARNTVVPALGGFALSLTAQMQYKGEDMPSNKTRSGEDRRDSIVAEARRKQQEREQDYREQALKIYPWICARCGREFSGKKLRMLTVHHKDHDHDNNPSDGSNWELLCIYCHDNEHSRSLDTDGYGEASPGNEENAPGTYKPFADLVDVLKEKK